MIPPSVCSYITTSSRYEASQPVDCKFLDLSGVNVSSSVMDIIIFLYTVLTHQHINNCHLSYLLTYHSHLTQVTVSVLCALYSILCTLYSVLCTLYSVLCTLYSVLCTLY